MKRIYLIRHGQSEANLRRVVPGFDTELTELGWKQAIKVAERLENLNIDALIASDFIRAQQTATPASEALGLPILVDANFGEMMEPSKYYGTGDDGAEVWDYRIKLRTNSLIDPAWQEDGGETMAGLFRRMQAAKQLLETHEHDNIAIFSHGFFLHCFVGFMLLKNEQPTEEWLEIIDTLRISNVGITMFTYTDDTWRLVTLNDYAHFAE